MREEVYTEQDFETTIRFLEDVKSMSRKQRFAYYKKLSMEEKKSISIIHWMFQLGLPPLLAE